MIRGRGYNCYLDFSSCFLVNLWPLVFHGSRADNTIVVSDNSMHATVASITRASSFVAVYGFRGENLTLMLDWLSRMERPVVVPSVPAVRCLRCS
jgi:hypothetical protein